MGSSELDPRRKRRRTARGHAGFSKLVGDRKKRCSLSLPWVAVIFGLGMATIVSVRTGLKDSARSRATVGGKPDKADHPLAVLLEQHDIDPQAARFADPVGRCYAIDEPPAARLGLFTCIADTGFLLRALSEALRFPLVAVVDVGDDSRSRPSRLVGHMLTVNTGSAFGGRDSGVVPEANLQARIKAGDDPLPDSAALVLIDVHEEVLSADAWMDLLRYLVQVLAENGAIVIRGPREEVESAAREGGGGAGEIGSAWYKSAQVWKAISALACHGKRSVTVAVGGLDGGIIVVRHAAPGEKGLETGCGRNNTDGGGGGIGKPATAEPAVVAEPPVPLQFEKLFLWVTRERETTNKAVEDVQAKFGGADFLRRYARRQRDRWACLSTHNGSMTADLTGDPSVEVVGGGGHLRTKRRHDRRLGRGEISSNDVASQRAARVCLERHLKMHTEDIRAGFALEMVLRAIGGNEVERQVTRLRAKVINESGPSGALLWSALHARAAGAAAAGFLR